jgi:MFS family permease
MLPSRPEARRLLVGTFLSSIGQGMTLPFLYVYLTEVRHLDPTVVGLVVAWMGLLGLILSGPVGALIDRFGARRVIMPLFLCDAVGVTSYGFVHTSWQALAAATVAALGGAAVWTGQNTILTTVTSDSERQHVFGLSFAILNLGIGIGGLIAGFIANVHHASSFQLLYAVNGLAVFAPVMILLSLRGVGGPIVQHDKGSSTEKRTRTHGGYREVFANRAFRRYAIFATVLMSVAYSQIEVGFPAFASTNAGVSPRVIALALTANTATIVVFQLFVLKRMNGRSRSRALALVGAIIGLSWLILGAGALGKSINPAIPIAGTILCSAVFACGETLMSPIMPALTNALATDELRGRYNAISSATWGLTAIVGPLTAAPLIGHHHANVWLGLVVVGALVASAIALSLRRLLTPNEDGRDLPATDDAQSMTVGDLIDGLGDGSIDDPMVGPGEPARAVTADRS